MPIRQALPLALAATLACAALPLNAAHANDGATFRDVLKPGGKERTSAQKLADGDACGTTGPTHTIPFMPTFEKCMNGKGWVLDHYTTADPRPAPGDTNTHYVDVKGDGNNNDRGDAGLQVDTRACQKTAKTDKAVNACLADHGWQIMLTQHGPALPRPRVVSTPPSQSPWGWSSGSSGSSDTSRDDEIHRDDAWNQQNQLNSDIQNQSNQSVNDQQAADAVQQQVDNNLANQPTFGQ
jgi:hypothetical protein